MKVNQKWKECTQIAKQKISFQIARIFIGKGEANQANKWQECLKIRKQTARIVQTKKPRNQLSNIQECLLLRKQDRKLTTYNNMFKQPSSKASKV